MQTAACEIFVYLKSSAIRSNYKPLPCQNMLFAIKGSVYTGRISPRVGHGVGLLQVRLRQAGMVAEEANETVRIVSINEPRSAESTRNPSPARRFWVSYSPCRAVCPLCFRLITFEILRIEKNIDGSHDRQGRGNHIPHFDFFLPSLKSSSE